MANAIPDKTSVIKLGTVMNHNFGVQSSRAARAHGELTKLLAQYARRLNPNLTSSSIQLCRDLPPKLHVDPRNTGQRGLVTFGDYAGGKCWAWGDVNGNVAMVVTDPIRNRPEISVGDVISGNLHGTKEGIVTSKLR